MRSRPIRCVVSIIFAELLVQAEPATSASNFRTLHLVRATLMLLLLPVVSPAFNVQVETCAPYYRPPLDALVAV